MGKKLKCEQCGKLFEKGITTKEQHKYCCNRCKCEADMKSGKKDFCEFC